MRATSMFVLVLWFIRVGAFAAFLISTILRAIHTIEGVSDDDDDFAGMSYKKGGNALPQNPPKSDDEDERQSEKLHNAFE